MRLLGLALFTLLVLGLVQYAFVKTDVGVGLISKIEDTRLIHDFVSEAPVQTCQPVGEGVLHSFPVRETDTWTSLSSAPGYQKSTFRLPKDVKVQNGVLILDVAAQLQTDGIARMRVNVNGSRRGDVILNGGNSTHRVRIDLSPTDLTQSELAVSLSAQGRFPRAACTAEWDGGIVVRIEPSSRIELTTEGPLVSLEDRLRATGNPVRMIWPENAGTADLGRLLRFAADRRARGTETEFVSASHSCPVAVALSPQDLSYADQIVALAPMTAHRQWPMNLAEDPALGEARFFDQTSTWRIPYTLRETPNAELPVRFDLGMTLMGMVEDESWLLSVTLNGRSVHSEQLHGRTSEVFREIRLPLHMQGFSNVLEVQLISSNVDDDQDCNEGVPVMAQLNPTTKLKHGALVEDLATARFAAALPEGLELRVSPEFNGTEATAAVGFLADAFGDKITWTPVDEVTQESRGVVELIWRAGLAGAAERHLAMPDRDVWLVWPRTIEERTDAPFGVVRVTSPDDVAYFPLLEGARIAAVVTLPAAEEARLLNSSLSRPAPADEATPTPVTQTAAAPLQDETQTEADQRQAAIDSAPALKTLVRKTKRPLPRSEPAPETGPETGPEPAPETGPEVLVTADPAAPQSVAPSVPLQSQPPALMPAPNLAPHQAPNQALRKVLPSAPSTEAPLQSRPSQPAEAREILVEATPMPTPMPTPMGIQGIEVATQAPRPAASAAPTPEAAQPEAPQIEPKPAALAATAPAPAIAPWLLDALAATRTPLPEPSSPQVAPPATAAVPALVQAQAPAALATPSQIIAPEASPQKPLHPAFMPARDSAPQAAPRALDPQDKQDQGVTPDQQTQDVLNSLGLRNIAPTAGTLPAGTLTAPAAQAPSGVIRREGSKVLTLTFHGQF